MREKLRIFPYGQYIVGIYVSLHAFWPTVLSVEPMVQCVVCRLSVCLSVCRL